MKCNSSDTKPILLSSVYSGVYVKTIVFLSKLALLLFSLLFLIQISMKLLQGLSIEAALDDLIGFFLPVIFITTVFSILYSYIFHRLANVSVCDSKRVIYLNNEIYKATEGCFIGELILFNTVIGIFRYQNRIMFMLPKGFVCLIPFSYNRRNPHNDSVLELREVFSEQE